MTMGQRLLALRTRAGLSQEALAERLGVSRQSISKWETDGSIPDLDRLIRLSEIFGVTLDELVKGMPEEQMLRDNQAAASLLHRLQALYRNKAYLLGWLLAGSGLLDAVRQVQVLLSFHGQATGASTLQWANAMLGSYLFTALKLMTGLAIVFLGRRFAGRFQWYHLGWALVVMGLFGIPQCIPFLRFGPLESLLTALLLHLRFYGLDKALEFLSLWYEVLWNFVFITLGLAIVFLGSRSQANKKSAE